MIFQKENFIPLFEIFNRNFLGLKFERLKNDDITTHLLLLVNISFRIHNAQKPLI